MTHQFSFSFETFMIKTADIKNIHGAKVQLIIFGLLEKRVSATEQCQCKSSQVAGYKTCNDFCHLVEPDTVIK